MKRTIAGFLCGLVLGSTGLASAGYYYTARELLMLRGDRTGNALVLGYIAGVHDVMAGLNPPTQAKLGDIRSGAIDWMLRQQDLDKPAYLYVVGHLVREQLIAQEDVARVFPESWRGGDVPTAKEERF